VVAVVMAEAESVVVTVMALAELVVAVLLAAGSRCYGDVTNMNRTRNSKGLDLKPALDTTMQTRTQQCKY
jgi:hypothetical protein